MNKKFAPQKEKIELFYKWLFKTSDFIKTGYVVRLLYSYLILHIHPIVLFRVSCYTYFIMQVRGECAVNSHERIKRTYERKETDRVPIIDTTWDGTRRRWRAEGMPHNADWRDFFGVDKVTYLTLDISPRYEVEILEETDRYIIKTTPWGTTEKEFKEEDSTPEMLDFKVTDAVAWADAKKRMLDLSGRLDIGSIKAQYEQARAEGQWIKACFWYGFDVTHSHMMGTENTLIAMIEEPELFCDMLDTYLTCNEKLFQTLWDEGVHFDEMFWYDDMGYKGTAFFSNEMYRELIQPFHKRSVDWAHDRGIYAYLHSCGNIMKLLPDIVDTGVDALNPLEVKAGMDAFKVKADYGESLVLHGGINAAIWKDTDRVIAEIREKLPVLMQGGGYIFGSDHSIPSNVSLKTMKTVVDEVKRLGKY